MIHVIFIDHVVQQQKMEVALVLLMSVVVASGSATKPFPRYVPREGMQWDPSGKGDPGEPLFLTPYIQKGEIAEGEMECKGMDGKRESGLMRCGAAWWQKLQHCLHFAQSTLATISIPCFKYSTHGSSLIWATVDRRLNIVYPKMNIISNAALILITCKKQ